MLRAVRSETKVKFMHKMQYFLSRKIDKKKCLHTFMQIKPYYIMEQSNQKANLQSVVFALIYGATYLPAAWLLKHQVFNKTVSTVIAIIPIVTFAIFIYKLIKAFAVLDEVKQRIQLEAVVIGFSLTTMLVMLLFLLSLIDITNPAWFGYGQIVGYCWAFYFVGWFISNKKYGV